MPKPYKKKSRRGVVLAFIALFLLGAAYIGFVATVTRDSTLPDPKIPSTPAPSLELLNQSIDRAEEYLDGLYKPLGEKDAVQSEHYGLPVRVLFLASKTWLLLGEDETSSIKPGPSGLTERYTVSFRNGDFVATVGTMWQPTVGEFTLVAQPVTVHEKAEFWVGDTLLGVMEPGNTKYLTSRLLTKADFPTLASLRYTVRHATQQALMYWQIRGDKQKAARLEHFLVSNGYVPSFDVRAIHFNRSAKLPDDLPYNREAYQDCSHLPSRDVRAYPYKSKACQVLGVYFEAAQRDPLLQATYALHMLQKYQQPKRNYQDEGWIQGGNPTETAQHLRLQWGRTNVGIPACTPIECQDVASGIRTFAYGMLEAELGYHYSDLTARNFADAAAYNTVVAQMVDGKVRLQDGEAYRPVFSGGILSYWDRDGRFAPPSPSLLGSMVGAVIDGAGMPPEYIGVLPSNSENTFDAWTFLVRYRCLKYTVGCYDPS